MRCARGKGVQVRRARAERVEVCLLEGGAQQQQCARVAAHHAQLAALAALAALTALAVSAATAFLTATALVADAHAVACLCDARIASRGVGAAALMRGGRGPLIVVLQAGAQPPHAQPVERGVARSQLAAARFDVRGGHLARMAHEARYRVQAGGEARCTGKEQPILRLGAKCVNALHTRCMRTSRRRSCLGALERNPHLQERLQCRWDGWLVPSQASWRTARHGLPLRSCGLRGPLP